MPKEIMFTIWNFIKSTDESKELKFEWVNKNLIRQVLPLNILKLILITITHYIW